MTSALVRLLAVERGDRRPIAQHGNAVADRKDLIEFMRDVDAGDSATPQIAQDIEQDEDFVFGQRGSRLIQNKDVRIFRKRLYDLHELFLAHPKLRDGLAWIDLDVELSQEQPRLVIDLVPIDQPSWRARLRAEKNIFADCHVINEREFLVDDGDPGVLRICERAKFRKLSVDEKISLV